MPPINPDVSRGLSVVAITQGECRVWSESLAPDTAPLRIHPKVFTGKKQFHTANEGQSHRGHDQDKFGQEYLESIATELESAKRIFVISHGTGKSDGFGALSDHLTKHHPDLEKRVMGNCEADFSHMSDPQILALSRDWLQSHAPFLG